MGTFSCTALGMATHHLPTGLALLLHWPHNARDLRVCPSSSRSYVAYVSLICCLCLAHMLPMSCSYVAYVLLPAGVPDLAHTDTVWRPTREEPRVNPRLPRRAALEPLKLEWDEAISTRVGTGAPATVVGGVVGGAVGGRAPAGGGTLGVNVPGWPVSVQDPALSWGQALEVPLAAQPQPRDVCAEWPPVPRHAACGIRPLCWGPVLSC